MGERRRVYKVTVRKPEGKRPLGRPRRRWEDNSSGSSGTGIWGVWTRSSWLGIGKGGEHL
jgi:hypothetical protein